MNITQSASDGVTVFHLAGHLDSTTSPGLQSAVTPAIETGMHRLVIGFGGVDYVSSAGLRVVLLAAKQARAAGGEVAIFGLGNPVRETFEISGFARVVAIVETEADAVRAVTG